jgi:hypothetical protein
MKAVKSIDQGRDCGTEFFDEPVQIDKAEVMRSTKRPSCEQEEDGQSHQPTNLAPLLLGFEIGHRSSRD